MAEPSPPAGGSGIPLTFKGEMRGDVAILHLMGGAYTLKDSAKLEKVFAGLRKAGRYRLVIDVSGLEYVNSLTIGHIVSFAAEAKTAGGRLALAAPKPTVMTMMRALGLTSAVLALNTVQEAVEVVSGEGPVAGRTTILR